MGIAKYQLSNIIGRILLKLIPTQLVLNKIKYAYNDEWESIRTQFKKIGKSHTIQGPFIFRNPKFISIGDNFSFMYNMRVEAYDNYMGIQYSPEIIIGDNVVFNTDCHIGCINKVEIGNNVLIASKVYISDHSHGEINAENLKISPILRPLISRGPVIIKDNVWIGEGVCILPGVTVGKNAIIGANAVVTKDVPENAVVAGNPAKVIKQFD